MRGLHSAPSWQAFARPTFYRFSLCAPRLPFEGKLSPRSQSAVTDEGSSFCIILAAVCRLYPFCPVRYAQMRACSLSSSFGDIVWIASPSPKASPRFTTPQSCALRGPRSKLSAELTDEVSPACTILAPFVKHPPATISALQGFPLEGKLSPRSQSAVTDEVSPVRHIGRRLPPYPFCPVRYAQMRTCSLSSSFGDIVWIASSVRGC